MTLPRRLKRPADDAGLRFAKPAQARLVWETGLGDAECRFGHAMVFGIEKVIVEHQAKRHEMVRVFGSCETCEKRRGQRSYQVGFYDRRQVRWYAIPTEGQYDDCQDWDGRVTEDMTREILKVSWNEPNGSV